MKKIALIVALAVSITLLGGCKPSTSGDPSAAIYKKAEQALRDKRAIVAYGLFSRILNYKDSAQKAESLRYALYYEPVFISSGIDLLYYLTKDGTLYGDPDSRLIEKEFIQQWTDLRSLNGDSFMTLAVKNDGTVNAITNANPAFGGHEALPELAKWNGIIQLAATLYYCAGLRSDGTVSVARIQPNAIGPKLDYSDVLAWSDIIQITFYRDILIGLKADGTVVASNSTLQEIMKKENASRIYSSWSEVVMVNQNVVLKRDGTVSTLFSDPNKYGISGWSDIVAVLGNASYGLQSDGTILDLKGNRYDQYRKTIYIAKTTGEKGEFLAVLSDGSAISTISESLQYIAGPVYDRLLKTNDILLPQAVDSSAYQNADDAAARFDPNDISYITKRAFPWLGGKYKQVVKFTGSAECGYTSWGVGLQDNAGNMLFEPKDYASIVPIAEDRFVIGTQGMTSSAFSDKIVDKNDNTVDGAYFKWIIFDHNDKLYDIGIALFTNWPTEYFFALIDKNGKRIDDKKYESMSFQDNDTILAKIADKEYTLDLKGNLISESKAQPTPGSDLSWKSPNNGKNDFAHSYDLIPQVYTDAEHHVEIFYPMVANTKLPAKEASINAALKRAVDNFLNSYGAQAKLDSLDFFSMDYQINLATDRILSVNFTGESKNKEQSRSTDVWLTVNIDMATGNVWNPASLVKYETAFSNLIKSGEVFTLSSSQSEYKQTIKADFTNASVYLSYDSIFFIAPITDDFGSEIVFQVKYDDITSVMRTTEPIWSYLDGLMDSGIDVIVNDMTDIEMKQSYWVDFESFGRSFFLSANRYSSVRFFIMTMNTILYELPVFNESKYRINSVSAVSFTDVNKDGLTDIIIVANGSSSTEYIAGIYYQQKNKTFTVDISLDRAINAAGQNLNIGMVLEFVGNYK